MVRGASAAKTAIVVSNGSSRTLPDIIAEAKTPVWFQIYADRSFDATIASARNAVEAGCRAVCLTIGVQPRNAGVALDWPTIGRLRQGLKAPQLLKAIINAKDARQTHGGRRPVVRRRLICCLRVRKR